MNKPRNFYKNTYHHIYNRGANKKKTFFERNDYLFFLRKLKKYKAKYSIDVLCYCLMPNHFHIFVRQLTEEKDLGMFISALTNSYTKAINKKYGREGVLFQGRTQNKFINDESYFIWIYKYILENPIKAGLVTKVYDWEFSSTKDFYGLRNGNISNKKFFIEVFKSLDNFKSFVDNLKIKVDYEL